MTSAFAITNAMTFARLDLLIAQIRVALRRTTGIPSDSLESIEAGIQRRWIGDVDVYGIDASYLCRAHLNIHIDWDEYNRQVSRGRVIVGIDEKWIDDASIEIQEATLTFNRHIQLKSLSTRWTVTYTKWTDRAEANRVLGFVPAEPIRWGSNPAGTSLIIPELPELCIGLELYD